MSTSQFFFAVLLVFFTASSGHAQLFGTVRGTIADPQGAVISGATVTLKAHASAFTKTTRSDDTGNFTFTTVPADSYIVEVEMDGFEKQSQPVNVAILSAPVLKFS